MLKVNFQFEFTLIIREISTMKYFVGLALVGLLQPQKLFCCFDPTSSYRAYSQCSFISIHVSSDFFLCKGFRAV